MGVAFNGPVDLTEVVVDKSLRPFVPSAAPGMMGMNELQEFYQALASAQGAPCDVLFMGDSMIQGVNSSNDGVTGKRFQNLLIERLRRAAGVRVGGRGYIPASYGGYTTASGFTLSGTAAQSDHGLAQNGRTMSASSTLTLTGVVCSSFDVFVKRQSGAGTLSVTIDGGAPTNVVLSDTPFGDGKKVNFAAVGSIGSTHTIVISHVSGSNVIFEGIMLYNGDESAGVRLWDNAKGGEPASDFNTVTTWQGAVTTIAPDLVILGHLQVEYQAQTALATYKSAVQSLITTLRTLKTDVPILLLAPQKSNFSVSPAAGKEHDKYVEQLRQLSFENTFCSFLDLSIYIEEFWSQTDVVHPDDNGQRMYCAITARELLRHWDDLPMKVVVSDEVTTVRVVTASTYSGLSAAAKRDDTHYLIVG
jgi:hypothetical protein